MAKQQPRPLTLDLDKFENVHQVGGIRTGTQDGPGVNGPSAGRVALVDTGAGLRFTVALDRGGDIVDATFNRHSLTYLTPHGLVPPNHAYNTGTDWLTGWPGGLVTTCGPLSLGRTEHGLHGHYSNLPAAVEMVVNPDPHRDVHEMMLSLIVRDSRMCGPVVEIRRVIRCTLGRPEIVIDDEVTNRGDQPCPHHWLYHCNFGYPLLDEGTRFIYRGKARFWISPTPRGAKNPGVFQPLSDAEMNRIKRVDAPLREHAGTGERGLVLDSSPGRDGYCRVGLINERLQLGVELRYPAKALPRVANWQHYGPAGCYVTGIEPFSGTLMGAANEDHPGTRQQLHPGESKRYKLVIRVLSSSAELRELTAQNGRVKN